MDAEIFRLTASLVDLGPAAPGALKEAEVALGISLPAGYSEFVTERDGAEGFVGPAYLALWKVGDLVELNGLADIDEFAPGLVLIGTNANLEGYGIDTRSRRPACQPGLRSRVEAPFPPLPSCSAGWRRSPLSTSPAILPPFRPEDDDTLRERIPVAIAYLVGGVSSVTVLVAGCRWVSRRR